MQTNRVRLKSSRSLNNGIAVLPMLLLVACGSESPNAPPPPTNQPPVATAGADKTVFESTATNLNGVGTDADGDTLTFAWTQTAGQQVTINNSAMATANFTTPDVVAGSPETLTFQIAVNDGTVSRTDVVNVTVEENEPPVASAGPDANVVENTLTTLNGTGSSDPNTIGTITYAWSQIGGVTVTLAGDDTAQPTFTAPDVAPGATEVLSFLLIVSDGVNNATDTVTITVEEGQAMVMISGKVNYQFVPPNANCLGLNFIGTVAQPIRGATVQLINAATGGVIDTTTSDNLGDYVFTNVAALTNVRLRVRAELKRSGSPSWDVEVRDNVDAGGNPPPLQNRPLYVLDGSDFNTGGADQNRNLTATTGWGGASYTGPRSAAPFAILDAIYSGIQLVLSADANATFAPLDAYWSVNNTLASPTDIDAGDLGASFYSSNPDGGAANPSLFLLGDANVDTEEFDDHVVVHEWGHYFEDNFSRSDSIGGPHSLGETLDARLSYGEGWATALAAMALDNPMYCDTGVPGTNSGFGIDAESGSFGVQGWYNEISVVTLLYDLFDTANDGTDDNSLGFQPIFDTMVGPQASTEAFTTVFSFATELRSMLNAQQQAFLDSQLERENIDSIGLDIWASNETNDVGGNRDVLPLYTDMIANGSVTNICTNSDFDRPDRDGNKLAEDRYIRLSVPATDTYDVVAATTTTTPVTADPNDRDQSDPDVYIYRDGALIAFGNGLVDNSEVFTTQGALIGGEIYSVTIEEWRFEDEGGAPTTYPEQICFDLSFTATP